MDYTVWKYEVDLYEGSDVSLEMPANAELLHAGIQHAEAIHAVTVWARVAPDAPRVTRHVLVRGTGHDAPAPLSAPHVGTVIAADGALVWHVFDGGET